jgi:hypothetical protein
LIAALTSAGIVGSAVAAPGLAAGAVKLAGNTLSLGAGALRAARVGANLLYLQHPVLVVEGTSIAVGTIISVEGDVSRIPEAVFTDPSTLLQIVEMVIITKAGSQIPVTMRTRIRRTAPRSNRLLLDVETVAEKKMVTPVANERGPSAPNPDGTSTGSLIPMARGHDFNRQVASDLESALEGKARQEVTVSDIPHPRREPGAFTRLDHVFLREDGYAAIALEQKSRDFRGKKTSSLDNIVTNDVLDSVGKYAGKKYDLRRDREPLFVAEIYLIYDARGGLIPNEFRSQIRAIVAVTATTLRGVVVRVGFRD